MDRILSSHDAQQSPSAGIHCSICPQRLVCLQWYRRLSLHFDYGDVVSAIECLGDVLSTPPFGFSLGGNSFCACHSFDGCYYLLCRDHVVLRLSEEEARALHGELAAARAVLDANPDAESQVVRDAVVS